jgi:2-phosphosulfolactate phosphatase
MILWRAVIFEDQSDHDLRCEWGLAGVSVLAPLSDVLIIVDVLSFSTAVDIAVSNGACVLPYRWQDNSAAAFAASHGALLASPRAPAGGYSLSPASLQSIPAGASLVLPSPNGSSLLMSAAAPAIFTARLRNCGAVAARARECGSRISVIPAGERWPDGLLRPALEDLVGAGAVLANLPGHLSPEAEMAVAVFERSRHNLQDALFHLQFRQGTGGTRIRTRRGIGRRACRKQCGPHPATRLPNERRAYDAPIAACSMARA